MYRNVLFSLKKWLYFPKKQYCSNRHTTLTLDRVSSNENNLSAGDVYNIFYYKSKEKRVPFLWQTFLLTMKIRVCSNVWTTIGKSVPLREFKPTGKRYRFLSVHTETAAVICGYEWCKKICLLLLVSKRGQCSVVCVRDISKYESRKFTIASGWREDIARSRDNNIAI